LGGARLALSWQVVCGAPMALVGATHHAVAIPKSYRVRMLASGSVTTQVAGVISPALVGIVLVHWNVPVVFASFGALTTPRTGLNPVAS
jgi:hypothetical protein